MLTGGVSGSEQGVCQGPDRGYVGFLTWDMRALPGNIGQGSQCMADYSTVSTGVKIPVRSVWLLRDVLRTSSRQVPAARLSGIRRVSV